MPAKMDKATNTVRRFAWKLVQDDDAFARIFNISRTGAVLWRKRNRLKAGRPRGVHK